MTDGDGGVCGVKVRSAGVESFVRARRGVVIAAGSFNLSVPLTTTNIPVVAEHGRPLGIDTNDGSGMLLGESVGVATQGLDGVIATGSIYPPAQLIKGIIVNKLGRRFVAEDVYHGRLAWNIERQPDQAAYLIVDEATAMPASDACCASSYRLLNDTTKGATRTSRSRLSEASAR